MKNHTRMYLSAFGYDTSDFICCEVCGKAGNDIHHIISRKMGGSKDKDTAENLMALCRDHHIEFGDKKQHVDYLKSVHEEFMRKQNVIF